MQLGGRSEGSVPVADRGESKGLTTVGDLQETSMGPNSPVLPDMNGNAKKNSSRISSSDTFASISNCPIANCKTGQADFPTSYTQSGLGKS